MLATYKKRSGTSDRGKEYEWLQCAYYALKFSTDDDILDFEMYTNNEFFGDFDDVTLRVRFNDGSLFVFLLQLKLSEKKKTLALSALTSTSGDFSLFKYLESYNSLVSLKNFIFILYTNRTANFKNDTKLMFGGDTIRVRHQECIARRLLDTNLTRNRSVFKFENDASGSHFFKQFYLFVNQQNDINLKDSISKLLKTNVKCDVYNTFVDFMRNWWAGNFKLTKYDVIAKLAEVVFSPMVRTLSDEKCNEKTELIKEAILKSELTIIDNEDSNIRDIWHEVSIPRNVKETSMVALKYGLTNKGINKIDELSLEAKAKVCWYLNEVPLIIYVEDSKKEEILAAIKLLERCKQKKKLVLVGFLLHSDFSNWKIFKDLSNISPVDLRTKITKDFHCQLQGKNPISLEELGAYNSTITRFFSVDYLLQIALSDCYNIGEDLEKLPSTYIPRSIPKILLNYNLIDGLQENIIYLSCNNQLEATQRRFNKRIMRITCSFAGVENFMKRCVYGTEEEFTEEVKAEKMRGPFHHFRVIDSNSLQWLNSGQFCKFEKLEQYRKITTDMSVEESEIDNHFQSKVKILTSHTGGGKTTFLKRIKNISPSDRFVVKINLKEHSHFLKSKLKFEEWWDYLVDFVAKNRAYDTLAKSLLRNFDRKRIVILWDSFDELQQDSRKFFIDCVTKLRLAGMIQWISTKTSFQKTLEKTFEVFALTMLPFRLDEQSYYIQKRSGVKDPATMDEFFKNINIVADSEYLGVPLQLYILTDIFNQNPESLKNILTLTDICHEFIEGRYTHHFKKTNCDVDFLVGVNFIENSKDYRLEQYKIAALKTHMPDLFEALNLQTNTKFLEEVKRGDFLGLILEVSEDGCIIFEHSIFGDYFSALWCSEHCHEAKTFLYQAKYRTIKFMFDLFLAEHRPIFIQILYRKFDNLVNCQIDKDRAGRSPLHVLCTYGQRHPLLDTETKDDTFIVDADRADSVQVDREELKHTLVYLKTLCDPLEKDDLFGWTCYDYADQSQALGLIEILGGGLDGILPNLQNYKDLPSVLFYSTKLNYTNLFKAITQVPYVEDNQRGNLLHVAAENDGEAFLTWLLHHRNYLRSINKTNNRHWTPIHFASFNGNLDVLKFLRSKGGTFRYQEPSLLSLATTHGHQNVVDYLISCNFNPNDCYHFYNFTQTLPLAISRGYTEIVKFMVNNGAGLYKIGKNSTNALHLALENEHIEIAEFLLEKGIGIDETDASDRNSYHHAAMNNQKTVILFLLKKKANFNAVDVMQRSPLHYAAQNGSSEIVEIFISHKIDINASDKDGLTPLHLAVQYGQVVIAQMLIDAGAVINALNKYKRTPIHLAALYGVPDCIETLASAGASLEDEEVLYERTPLHFAAWNGHEDCVQVLIGKGVKIDPPCYFRYTPLHLAAEAGSYECCQLLIEAGASIFAQNVNDRRPLDIIDNENYSLYMLFLERYSYPFHHTTIPETLSELVERGIDINGLDENGVTALHIQASSKRWSSLGMMEALISKGADIKSRDRDGYLPLHYALQISFENLKKVKMLMNADLENETVRMKTNTGTTALHLVIIQEERGLDIFPVVQLLIDRGAEINASDNNGFTPLHYACQSGNFDVVKLLTSRGAEINRLNNHKRGALHMAAISGSILIVEHLLEEGASIDVVDIDGDTPLDDALNAEHPQLFKILLTKSSRQGAIDSTNRKGRSVLHMASKRGSLDLVKFFLERTTSVDVVDNFGNTPLDDALFNKHYEIFDLLIQHSKIFDVNKFNQHYKCYPLHVATTPKILNLLIAKGAKLDVADVDGNTPLHLASLAFREEIIQLLLNQDADSKAINIRNRKGETPLHIIMHRYCDMKEEVVKLLIKKGAKIDIEDEDGNTPFDIQFHKDRVKCKEILLFGLKNYDTNKASNDTRKTLLHLAAKYGDLELAKWLMERGASFNLTDCDGDTPLHLACRHGKIEMAKFILEKFRKSVDITKTNKKGETVLYCAIGGYEKPNLHLIKLLVDTGASVDTITKYGRTPLYKAFLEKDADCFRFLMGKVSNINIAIADSGYTLLHMAAFMGETDLARNCLEQGLKINDVDKNGTTPLHEAFEKNHLEVLELLLDHDNDGSSINMANESGQTLLHQAAEAGNFDMVKLLVRKGAKIDLFDGSGDNPIDLALKNKHTDVYHYLNEKLETLQRRL